MADVLFQQVLQFNQNQLFAPNRRGGQTSSSGKGKATTTCATPTTPGTPGASTGTTFTPPAASPAPFLKGILVKEKEEIERLM